MIFFSALSYQRGSLSRTHVNYRRKPKDLPCAGRPIRLLLTLKKFLCRQPKCRRKIFVERLPDLVEVWSRLTMRLRNAVQEIGFAACGKGGERLASKLGVPISDATLLWSLYLVPLLPFGQVEMIGVDDWSYRHGKDYGSIIVDLQTHKIIELLPERTNQRVITWLEAHPEVGIVSRDRGGVYVDGATQGAPLATQVSDRWHLPKNLVEAVEAYLIRDRARLPEIARTSPTGEPLETARAAPTQERSLTTYSAAPARQGRTQARLLRKWELYKRIQELHRGGMSTHKIGEELGRARGTVRKYFRQPPEPPLPTPRALQASKIDRYEDNILSRLSQCCTNVAQIYREITALGFTGWQSNVRAYVTHLRKSTAQGQPPAKRSERAKALAPCALRWLLPSEHKEPDQEEQAQLDLLLTSSKQVRTAHTHLHAFLGMVRERKPEQLHPWMQQVIASGVPELKSFAAGVERDYDAVKAALHLPWS